MAGLLGGCRAVGVAVPLHVFAGADFGEGEALEVVGFGEQGVERELGVVGAIAFPVCGAGGGAGFVVDEHGGRCRVGFRVGSGVKYGVQAIDAEVEGERAYGDLPFLLR